MNSLSFGWIGNGNKIRLRKRTEVTQLSNIIKGVLTGCKRYEEQEIRAKNLVSYGGKVLYILSIKKTGSMWGPYPFIDAFLGRDDFCLLLAKGEVTENMEGVSGEFWLLNQDGIQEYLCDETGNLKLKLNDGRIVGGAYYSLPQKLVEKETGVTFHNREELGSTLRKALEAL